MPQDLRGLLELGWGFIKERGFGEFVAVWLMFVVSRILVRIGKELYHIQQAEVENTTTLRLMWSLWGSREGGDDDASG